MIKSTLLLLAASFGAAQDFSGQPACATSCLASAITAAGCALTDEACQCGPTQASIAGFAASCLLAACNASDLTAAESAGDAACSSFSVTATATATGTASSSSTSSGSSSSSGSVSSTTSTATTSSGSSSSASAATTSKATTTTKASSSNATSSTTSSSASAAATAGAGLVGANVAGGLLAAFLGAVAAL